ncbi:MAG TPA: acyl-CoA dehydrogenase family protein [Candidatus Thermoplasmatota archaeon]|nr:acyl-CoA dehydrogenase family protein [Candidatus Thermoplasmatota archaeon]
MEPAAPDPLLDALRRLCAERIAPMAQQLDREQRFPDIHLQELAKLGVMGLAVPREQGGLGRDTATFMAVMEELAAACASTAITWGVHASVATHPIVEFGSPEQQRHWLPQLARGERLGAFALSEAGSASDAAGSMSATAVRRGDEYVLNGQKVWITNAAHAGLLIVMAKTSPELRARGISAFIVPRETPGVTVGKHEDKLGLRASETSTLHLDDARVPAANLLAGEGDGFKIAMRALDASRIGVGAQGVGLARAALAHAVAWARDHPQGQGVQFQLADLAARLDAARMLVQRAAALRDAGQAFTREASMAKLFATELAVRAASVGVSLRGEAGVLEGDAERVFRDARVTTIYEGTSEIQRVVIARHLGLPP